MLIIKFVVNNHMKTILLTVLMLIGNKLSSVICSICGAIKSFF